MYSLSSTLSPQTDQDKEPDYDSLPSQTSQSESSMLQVICRPEATNKEDAYTFHTVHSKCKILLCGINSLKSTNWLQTLDNVVVN